MRQLATLLLLAAIVPTAFADSYRCTEGGKTIFSDRPCTGAVLPRAQSGNSPNVIGDAGNSAYSTTNGEWRGQVQFQAMQNGKPIGDAHAVVAMVIGIEPQGRITGAATGNGCKFSGIASPGMMPRIANLDITLTGCKYPEFNRRLSGTFALYPEQKHSQLWIFASPVSFTKPGQSFEVKGTLRR